MKTTAINSERIGHKLNRGNGYWVSKNEDGTLRRCSRGDYVKAEIESGRDIEVITLEDLLSLLGTSREELESMPELDTEYLLDDKYKK